MTKYRKKPVVVEAMQRNGTMARDLDIADWMERSDPPGEYRVDGRTFQLVTLKGILFAGPKDFIIHGTFGDFYPCPEHVFQATYEVAEGLG